MTRTFLTFAALLFFSFGGGLIGGYIGGLQAARGPSGDTVATFAQLDRVKTVSVNLAASLASDTEILAGDIADLTQRVNALDVRLKDLTRPRPGN